MTSRSMVNNLRTFPLQYRTTPQIAQDHEIKGEEPYSRFIANLDFLRGGHESMTFEVSYCGVWLWQTGLCWDGLQLAKVPMIDDRPNVFSLFRDFQKLSFLSMIPEILKSPSPSQLIKDQIFWCPTQ